MCVGHENSVDAICANPLKNGQYATGSHDKTLKLWDSSGKCLKTMKGHELGVWSLNYFPDGKRLVSASSDGMAKIWDANSGKCTATLKKHTKRVSHAFELQISQTLKMAGKV